MLLIVRNKMKQKICKNCGHEDWVHVVREGKPICATYIEDKEVMCSCKKFEEKKDE